jgi:hypothetical protein
MSLLLSDLGNRSGEGKTDNATLADLGAGGDHRQFTAVGDFGGARARFLSRHGAVGTDVMPLSPEACEDR